MKPIAELILRWQEDDLDAAGLAELRTVLGTPAGRSRFLEHLGLSVALMRLADEKLLQAPAPVRRWRWSGRCAAALVLMAIGATALWLATPPPLATVVAVAAGAAPDIERGAARLPIVVGTALRAGDRIRTGAAGLSLRYADEATRIDLAADSSLRLLESPGRREVRLEDGRLEAQVAKQPADRVLAFTTVHAEARVIGTRLALALEGQRTRLSVSEGRVRFQATGGGQAVEVAAAASAVASADGVQLEAAAGAAPLAPAAGCLWGVSLRAEAPAAAQLTALEAGIGRPFALVHQYQAFSDFRQDRPFPSAAQRLWAEGGRLLMIDWKPRLGDQPLLWAEVADGLYDAEYVDPLARKAAAWGRPFFLSLHHDPESQIGPAGSGMEAADFVRMWRHVHARFTAAGAGQVVWVWSMSGATAAAPLWNACYPGDDCVDWLACAAYNNLRGADGQGPWLSLRELVTPFITWMRQDFSGDHRKPLMLSVYACSEDPGSPTAKADWFRALPGEVRDIPEIKALIYFHDRALSADSSPAALAGFRTAAADPFFNPTPRDAAAP